MRVLLFTYQRVTSTRDAMVCHSPFPPPFCSFSACVLQFQASLPDAPESGQKAGPIRILSVTR